MHNYKNKYFHFKLLNNNIINYK